MSHLVGLDDHIAQLVINVGIGMVQRIDSAFRIVGQIVDKLRFVAFCILNGNQLAVTIVNIPSDLGPVRMDDNAGDVIAEKLTFV